MIAGLSKATTLYLAPLLTITAIVLSVLAFLAPTLVLQDKVALLTVTPSTGDGPSVWLGTLGSCSRPKNDGKVNCTIATLSPVYDLSALPSSAPRLLLSAPTEATPVFIGLALACSGIFFVTFILISFRHKMGARMTAMMDTPMIQRFSAWIGFFGFMIGITSFLILRMWFGKAADDFNNSISVQGSHGQGPQLIANVGNAFTMVWVAYAFYAVPVIISLSKLNVTATK
ncbi:hypothetical protein B0H17DRAFT_919365 [Mycena rosella]|uniref:Uncharacterized protein n=1 Tax=Mycena rosella TaxID=1033263 RepID=A0AAD7GVG2_MYCRO|nr:hypothetical protein B0H17DRAFT_919365 [Mycena rosella]